MTLENIQNFEEVSLNAEDLYRGWDKVYCPYIKGEINFNSQGWEHLKFKRRGKARPQQDQYMRLKLLHLAPIVIKSSHTLQGILETKSFEKVRVHNRTDSVMKDVTYCEFIAVIDRNRVKVIVKRVGEGEYFFWSIIPFWGVNKETLKRKLHSGYPEEE